MKVAFTVFLAFFLFFFSQAQAAQTPKILVLQSYHQGYGWSDSVMDGIISVLGLNEQRVEYYVEYMDTKRFPPEKVFPLLHLTLAAHYENTHLDVIIAVDDNALDFLLAYRDDLFPQVPVVFCGVNDFSDERLGGQKGYTGVVEDFDVGHTLEIIHELQPEITTIASVSDVTETSKTNLAKLREAYPKFENTFNFIELSELSTESLLKELHDLPPKTAILHLNFFRGPDGRTYSPGQSVSLVIRATKAPIYSMWEWYLGHGIVGGMLISGFAHGESAAGLTVNILHGFSPESLPIIRKSPNRPMFDYVQLKHYKIDFSLLPHGSEIVNKPATFYWRYKKLFWVTIAIFTVLTTMVIALGFAVLRRRQAEKALRLSEEKYRLLVENQSDLIVKVDMENRFLYVSPSYCRLFGRREEELLGKTFIPLVHEEDRESTLEAKNKLLSPPYKVYFEHRAMTTDGWKWLGWMATAVLDEKGEVADILGVGRDVTDRRLAEDALRESERRFSMFMDQAPAVVLLEDHEARLLYTNKYMREVLGSDESHLGKRPDEFLPPDIGGTITRESLQALETGFLMVEETLPTKSGKPGVFKTIKFAIPQPGKPPVLGGISWDITEQKRIERELIKSREAAEAANKAKTQFLATMSHEIRTPLNGVMSMLQLARNADGEKERAECLDIALESSRSLLRILNDILDLSRIEAGTLEMAEEEYQVSQVFETVVVALKEEAARKDIKLACELENLPERLVGDAGRLRQILFNLTGNAIRYTERGEVHVYARTLPFSPEPGATQLLVVVSDTGIGIKGEELHKLFRPFTQVNGSLKRRQGGTGLGLSIVKRLVTLLRGSITVDSEPGKGTDIYISLRQKTAVSRSLPADDIAAAESASAGLSLTILVVEDETINLKAAMRMLEMLGCKAEGVRSGADALKKLEEGSFDAVLMDIQMPEMDGVEVTQLIRKDTSGRFDSDIPIIAYTAHAMKGDQARFLAAGMSDYISKPVEMDELRAVLGRVAARMQSDH